MELLLAHYGLPGLFVLAFLAATVLPVASEGAVVALVLAGVSPWACVIVATEGNTLCAMTTWGLGRWGSEALLARVLGLQESRRVRARALFDRYGAWSLLLAWAPIIGDPLCAVAGLFGLRLSRFLPPVLAGKLARYAVLAWLSV